MIIDTNSNCARQTGWLVDRGVEIIGRYYSRRHPDYALARAEAQAISAAGMKIFTVYEDFGQAAQFDLSRDQGQRDGAEALRQAHAVGQPQGTVIYFALEGLPNGYRAADIQHILQYCGGVAAGLADQYTIGVYGDGVVCQSLLDEGVCTHTWLAQASYSFEGSKAFYRRRRWNLAQILTDLPADKWKQLSVDINEGQGEVGAFSV